MGVQNERETGPFSRNISSAPMEISIAEATSLFPGFRFSPTDEELIRYYLTKKLEGSDKGVDVIPEVDICRHEPWDLPAQSVIRSENEWFFFSPHGRKYPNGSQSKRATESGYWKATGKERSVKSGSSLIGTKRTLVFHMGRAPKGQRTEWIMHEYCTREKSQDVMVVCRLRKNHEFHLNDNPRMTSLSQSDNLDVYNNSTTALSDGEQSTLLEEMKVVDGGSKEDSSSYSSHSVEQGYAEEEDCYADIMKDDIIDLDDSSLNVTPQLLPIAALKLKSETKYMQLDQATAHVLPFRAAANPFQGTANRRLRLRRQRMGPHQVEPYKIYKFEKESRPTQKTPGSISQQEPSQLVDHLLPITKIKLPLTFLFLVMLVLLVLYLSLEGYLSQAVKFTDDPKFESMNWCGYFPSILR